MDFNLRSSSIRLPQQSNGHIGLNLERHDSKLTATMAEVRLG